jgi:ribosomal protein S18 acetylase RimI-like enzyme
MCGTYPIQQRKRIRCELGKQPAVRWDLTYQNIFVLEIRQLTPPEAPQHIRALADTLLDCVEAGASVSFMASLSRADAESFFANVLEDVQRADRILLAAFLDSELVGTVQILTAMPPNQTHRADVAKLLVRRSARRRGVARQLMERVEEASRLAGKTLLVLDTATGDPA